MHLLPSAKPCRGLPDARAAAPCAARFRRAGWRRWHAKKSAATRPWRLYRARASAVYVLEDEHDRRVPVQLAR